MDKKVTRLVQRGFISTALICIVVFVLLTELMSYKTQESIKEISNIYMSEMNTQIQQKFSVIIGLCLERVEGIVKGTPATEMKLTEEMLETMERDGSGK